MTNDFFTKDFPTGEVRLEAKTLSRNLFALKPIGIQQGGKDTFSDEFKMIASRDNSTGSVTATVTNTSTFNVKDKFGNNNS